MNDRFFTDAVRPFCWFAAILLFFSYLIGLWFTLRTHAAVIWNDALDEKKPVPQNIANGAPTTPHTAQTILRKSSASNLGTGSTAVRDTQLYKRILGQSLRQIGLDHAQTAGDPALSAPATGSGSPLSTSIPHLVPPKSVKSEDTSKFVDGLSSEQNEQLVRQVAEVAATAATVAARDAYRSPRIVQSAISATTPYPLKKPSAPPTIVGDDHTHEGQDAHGGGGHDAPNWSRAKSTAILLGATVLYAVIAEILVNTVDVVLENIDIDEKFLGITLFALVPNTTEFLVSFVVPCCGVNFCLTVHTERYFIRNEWQHRAFNGDRICICAPSLLVADSRPRFL